MTVKKLGDGSANLGSSPYLGSSIVIANKIVRPGGEAGLGGVGDISITRAGDWVSGSDPGVTPFDGIVVQNEGAVGSLILGATGGGYITVYGTLRLTASPASGGSLGLIEQLGAPGETNYFASSIRMDGGLDLTGAGLGISVGYAGISASGEITSTTSNITSTAGSVNAATTVNIITTDQGTQDIPGEQYRWLGANATGITTVATNPFGASPNLTLNGVYDFEYFIPVANSSTGIITLGWASTAAAVFFAEVLVLPTANGTAYAGINPFINSTANKAITGGNTAATYLIKIRGSMLKTTATARFPLQMSVASGTITVQKGAWFRFTNRRVSASGTTTLNYGNIA